MFDNGVRKIGRYKYSTVKVDPETGEESERQLKFSGDIVVPITTGPKVVTGSNAVFRKGWDNIWSQN